MNISFLRTFQTVWYKSNKNKLIFCAIQVHLNAHFYYLKSVRYYLSFQHPAMFYEIFHTEYTAVLSSVPIHIFKWQGDICFFENGADKHLSLLGHDGMWIGI